ncbi:hypothetical protein GCM10025876_35100 [Demequina litorisediminis]|uniref:Uncharacterized protein n=1 Tax=Demequina litorisediminis TaxID=1849022 RepID=A0ABQ6IJM1_9MICO|nr:hypothetical protein GCM10025876_35100 [Demequina litorisediminis]
MGHASHGASPQASAMKNSTTTATSEDPSVTAAKTFWKDHWRERNDVMRLASHGGRCGRIGLATEPRPPGASASGCRGGREADPRESYETDGNGEPGERGHPDA